MDGIGPTMRNTRDGIQAGERVFVGLGASMISVVLFGFGLVAPLTPSEGCPTALAVLAFAGLPVLLTGGGALVATGLLRGALVVQTVATGGAAVYLLERIGCWG